MHLVYLGYHSFSLRHRENSLQSSTSQSILSNGAEDQQSTPPIHTNTTRAKQETRTPKKRTKSLMIPAHHSPFNGKSLELAPTRMVNFPLVGMTQFPLPVLQ